VLKDLREAQGKIADFKERVIAAEDQLKRVDLRAPQAGVIHQLAIHTVGGVISNGETIMQIGPRADDLVLEAKVPPSDIDQVALGAETAVRVLAGNQRTTPVITGRLTRVSADITHDQQQNSAQPIRLVTPSASRCRPKRWPACATFISFPACRLRASSRPTNAAHCNTCSSRYKSRSRGRFASGESAERL
jgi:HlyD family secretion protein